MEVRKGYKQTEVGIIPNDWEVKPLGRLVSSVEYGSSAKSDTQGQIPVLRMGNLQGGKIDWKDLVYTSNEREISKYQLRPGDVLFNRTNTIDLVGKTSIYNGEHPAIFAGYLIRINFDNSLLNPEFLNYVLNAEFSKKYSSKVLSVAVGQANINGQKLKTYPIPFPPTKAEQDAIAAALSDVDALLNSLDALIAKKLLIKQGVMQELLTSKKRLPGFSGEWEKASIADLEKKGWLKLSRGEVISKKDIDNIPGDYPIYSSSIKNSGLFGKYGKFMFDEELITWSVDGGGNFFYRHKHKFSVTNVSGFMRVDTSIFSYRFLAYELEALHSRLVFDYQTKAHPSVIRKAYDVLVPSLPEQTAIAEILSDMDAEISALEARREKTRLLKQGMMQELLTGRIRLV